MTPRLAAPHPAAESVAWRPSTGDVVRINLVGTAVGLGGLVAALWLRWRGRPAPTSIRLQLGDMLLVLAAIVVAMVAHELVHGLAVRLVGHRPRYGAGITHGMPYLSTSAPGVRFTMPHYLFVALLPSLLVNLALFLPVVFASWGGVLAVPLLVHLAGCAGDWLMVSGVLRRGRGMLVEDTGDGFTLHPVA